MPDKPMDAAVQELLRGRRIAAFGTENVDGSIHLTAVWYLFEEGSLFVATNSKTRKARNAAARGKASLMLDVRTPGTERGVTISGKAALVSGEESRRLNERIHQRYLSAAAMADPGVGGVFAGFDDVTIRLTPESWFAWDMAVLDAQVLGGKLGKTPSHMLPLD